MDRVIRKVEDERRQLMETLHYWQSRPDYERMEAVATIVREAYAAKSIDIDEQSYPKTIARVRHPRLIQAGENQ